MEVRTLIKIKNSLFVNVPEESVKNLNLKKGNRCEIVLLPGYGVLVRKEEDWKEYPVPQEAEYQAQRAGREAYEETKRKIKALAAIELRHFGESVAGTMMGQLLPIIFHAAKQLRDISESFEGDQKAPVPGPASSAVNEKSRPPAKKKVDRRPIKNLLRARGRGDGKAGPD